MHKKIALKRILEFTLKQLQRVSASSLSSGSVLCRTVQQTYTN